MTDEPARKLPPEAAAVLAFWETAGEKAWFTRNEDFDETIARTFGRLYDHAVSGGCEDWAETAEGALALVLVFDQFSRNLFRDDPRAYAQDARARHIALAAIERGFDTAIGKDLRLFFYMPFMHAEDAAEQAYCVELITAMADDENLKHAHIHQDVIAKFGRFPHRNAVLGRDTTPAEQAFLDEGGFSG